MRLCGCFLPARAAATELLRCARCDGHTAHGPLPGPEAFRSDTAEAVYLLGRLAKEYPWAHDLAHDPTRHQPPGAGGHGGDPTGGSVTDDRRQDTRTWALVAARRLDQALLELREAFAAIGEAIRLQDRRGPADHTPAPYHDPASLYATRPDLAAQLAAQERRHARGEL